ncbi:tripartite tricarboxylate transporter TctB family protein [Bacillus sp. FJAT-27245]|uniref:tripartite tricarboxylate transporter TctB family protein n=1 Tax=Bacillus sp. FJAT-27245 TaxID=1684144 RepID=UPI0006A7E0FB|nr:tripartite tricarboxylate transporter TctB family protein [Bacillus sp. FJAT-27245]
MKNIGLYVSLLFLTIGGIVLIQSLSLNYYSEFGPGPGLLPMWISGLMIILSIINIFSSLKKDAIKFADVMPKGEGLKNVLLTAGTLLLFIVTVPYIGFVLASFLMLFLLFLRGYKWYIGMGLAAGIALFVFWLFGSILSVPLPVNSFGW